MHAIVPFLLIVSLSISPGHSTSPGPSISPVVGYVVLMGIRALEWKLIIRRAMLPAYTTRAVNARMLGHVVLGTSGRPSLISPAS